MGSVVKIDSGSGGDVHFLVSMKLLRFIGIDYSLDDEKEKEILDQVILTHSFIHSLTYLLTYLLTHSMLSERIQTITITPWAQLSV